MTHPHSEYNFRPIQKKYNESVARLIRETMTEFEMTGDDTSFADPEIEAMFEAYDNEKSHFFILTKKGEVVGCGGIGPLRGSDGTTCELRKMYFRPKVRGLGFGKQLVKMCLDKALELGYKKCYLETTGSMKRANFLYQKLGFRKLDARMGNTGHCGCGLWYVKEL